MVTKS